jgi:O-glycosyl hydrolase
MKKKVNLASILIGCIILFCTCCSKDDMPIKPPTTPTVKDTTKTVVTQSGTITLNLNNPQQKIDMMGAGCYFYSGHIVKAANYSSLSEWLFRDLEVNVFRIVLRNGGVEDTNDNADPNVTDFSKFNFGANTNNTDQIEVAKKAQSINPNIKIWAIVLSPPKFLKTNNNVNFGGTLNVATANVYEEFGESTYAHLKYLKDNGLTVDFLSLMNEPDFAASAIGYESADYNTFQAKEVYKNTGDWLKTKLATTNIGMPKLSAPDCISVRSIANYAPSLEATGNVSLYTAHQYSNSSVANFSAATTTLGTKPLYMAEMHVGFGLGETPSELPVALDLVTRFNEAFKGGAKGWLYFEWGNPKTNFGGLTFTPFGSIAERKKNYYVYQQFATNLLNSSYVPTVVTDAKNIVLDNISAFTKANSADIHVANLSDIAQNKVRLNFGLNVKTVKIYRTSSTDNNTLIESKDNVNANFYDVDYASKSFTTVRVTF